MQGTVSEPSAWAPVIPIVLLLAVKHRSWLYVFLALVGVVLADSPTCFLVLAVTLPVYFALTSSWRWRIPLLVMLSVLIPLAAFFVQSASPSNYLNSENPALIAVGRLLSGIRNVETGGQVGSNDRYSSTTVVITQTEQNGWLYTGAGPAADGTYFRAKYPATGPIYGTNSLWVTALFDFGVGGVFAIGLLMLAAIWRMRNDRTMAAILLPFFVASLVNSAEGPFLYVYVVLGVMLFAFGWIESPAQRLALGDDKGMGGETFTQHGKALIIGDRSKG
jgi:hypothetical protein